MSEMATIAVVDPVQITLGALGRRPRPFLTVIIPVFNEYGTLEELTSRVLRIPLSKEVLIVDDGSTDGTRAVLQRLEALPEVRRLCHEHNRGKGAAIRTALRQAVGDIIVIQDADLEYNAEEIVRLVGPIADRTADVVFGSRLAASQVSEWRPAYRLANRALTWASNRLTGLRLTDMETCYKAMRREVVESLLLRENRFGFEPEFTAKVARLGFRIVEVPISYDPRGRSAGKKIGVWDGFRALWCIFRYSLWD